MKRVLLVAAFMLCAGSATAEELEPVPVPYHARITEISGFVTGNELYLDCQIAVGPPDGGTAYNRAFMKCYSYIMGSYDALTVMWGVNTMCMPDKVTAQQLVDIVTTGLRNLPSERHRPAAYITGLLLQNAFPCPEQPAAKPTSTGPTKL